MNARKNRLIALGFAHVRSAIRREQRRRDRETSDGHRHAEVAGPRYKHDADESAPYETITIDKLTPIIGAEIGGIDLSKPLSNRTSDEIHRALAENLVIFFRDQHLTQEQHLGFGRDVRRPAHPSGRATCAGPSAN